MSDVQTPVIERVRTAVVGFASTYKSEFIEREYLVYAKGLTENPYYIVCANDYNFAHLTGVHPLIPPKSFFNKCLDGSLTTTDFDFVKSGKSEKEVKGAVKGKIKSFPNLSGLFNKALEIEESFIHNMVNCEIAASEGSLTLGFAVTPHTTIPRTLLSKNELTSAAVPVELVLSRQSGTNLFNTIEQGDINVLKDKGVEHLLSDELRALIVPKEKSAPLETPEEYSIDIVKCTKLDTSISEDEISGETKKDLVTV